MQMQFHPWTSTQQTEKTRARNQTSTLTARANVPTSPTPSATTMAGPSTPSTALQSKPWELSHACRQRTVCGPMRPSTSAPTTRWMARTSEEPSAP